MCGLLLINKPEGITSFGVVSKVRRLTGQKHVGHTGTLDPMATGVLPVLIGRATKLSDYILCANKAYKATVKLGITTDTLDITGKMLESKKVSVTNEEIDEALKRFTGEIEQTPPMFSAIKKDGVRLYSLAREGKQVEIPSRKVCVFSLNRQTDIDENYQFDISCRVSKGTYIRSLVNDIGAYLGTGAAVSSLIRTETAGFDISDCVSLENLNEDNIEKYILPASKAVENFRQVTITRAQAFRFSNGGNLDINRLKCDKILDGEIIRVNSDNRFLGLACVFSDENIIKPKCLIDPVTKE